MVYSHWGKKTVFFPSVIFEICLNYRLNYWNKCLIQKLAVKMWHREAAGGDGILADPSWKAPMWIVFSLSDYDRTYRRPWPWLTCDNSYCYLVNSGSRGLDATELAVFRRATNSTKCFSLLPTGSGESLALGLGNFKCDRQKICSVTFHDPLEETSPYKMISIGLFSRWICKIYLTAW